MDNDINKPPTSSSSDGSNVDITRINTTPTENNQSNPESTNSMGQPQLSTPVVSGNIKQKGSMAGKLVGILIILLLIVGIYGAYAWQHNKVNNLTSQVNSLNSEISSLQNKNKLLAEITPASGGSKVTYKFAQIGVQVTVPGILSDLTYDLNSQNTVANLSTQTLTDLDSACTANAAKGEALGDLYKVTGQYSASKANGMTLVKQFSGYYIAYTPPIGACSSDAAINQLANTLTAALKTSFSTIATTSS